MSTRNVVTDHGAGDSRERTMRSAWQWITVIFAAAILVQATLASFGLFDDQPLLVDIHRELGNILPLLAIAQGVLTFVLHRRGMAGRTELWIGIALVPLVIGQLSMGYETGESSLAIALHIPLGVLLMGLTTLNAALAWTSRRRR